MFSSKRHLLHHYCNTRADLRSDWRPFPRSQYVHQDSWIWWEAKLNSFLFSRSKDRFKQFFYGFTGSTGPYGLYGPGLRDLTGYGLYGPTGLTGRLRDYGPYGPWGPLRESEPSSVDSCQFKGCASDSRWHEAKFKWAATCGPEPIANEGVSMKAAWEWKKCGVV